LINTRSRHAAGVRRPHDNYVLAISRPKSHERRNEVLLWMTKLSSKGEIRRVYQVLKLDSTVTPTYLSFSLNRCLSHSIIQFAYSLKKLSPITGTLIMVSEISRVMLRHHGLLSTNATTTLIRGKRSRSSDQASAMVALHRTYCVTKRNDKSMMLVLVAPPRSR